MSDSKIQTTLQDAPPTQFETTLEKIIRDLKGEAEKLHVLRDAARRRGELELSAAYNEQASAHVRAAASIRSSIARTPPAKRPQQRRCEP